MRSLSFHHFLLASFLGVASTSTVVACDDPPKPEEKDGKVAKILSQGCKGESAATQKGFQSQTMVEVKGTDRTYDWLIPDAHDGRHPVPVIFVYHGDGQKGADIRAQYKIEDVVGGKAFVVYPDAVGTTKEWDIERGGDSNADMVFFDEILKTLSEGFCIDTNRVFVAGVSRGAYFANGLGCQRGGSIRAIAANSGGGPSSTTDDFDGKLSCPEKPVAALVVHGKNDTEVALTEGEFSRDYWSRVNGCRPGGLEVFDPAPCISQLSCAQGRPVVYCEVPDLGHAVWSEAPRAAWKFFDQL
jgi:polyhydroxybutyrate depolymerase